MRKPSKNLETFANPNPSRDFHIHMEIPELLVCAQNRSTGFCDNLLGLHSRQHCVELKSLKLYIWSFRDEGCFHEAVTNQILDDLVTATLPKFMRVTAKFFVRGGIFTNVIAEHRKTGWQPQPLVNLSTV